MNKLQPVMLLMPVIALILVLIFYFTLLKKSTNKKAFTRFIFIMSTLAFVLNFVWELLHLPLYKNNVYDLQHISLCVLASIADAIMVMLIYFCFALIYKDAWWVKNMTFQRALMLIVTGGIGAVLAEMRHLSTGDWVYAASMPIIPFVHAGLSPVLQFAILPLLIYQISIVFHKRSTQHFQ